MKIPVLSEEQECYLLVDYLEILQAQGKVALFTHIPASTYTEHWNSKMKNKRMGVRPGFPDYAIMTNTKLILIEMKRTKGGVVSPEQRTWIEGCIDIPGVSAYICRGFRDAKMALDNELTGRG